MAKSKMDILAYNRDAWDQQVETKSPWTQPVTSEQIAAARTGDFKIVLTPLKPVPAEWFPELDGCETLCLASGGGQQGPILSAAGAHVTVFDNSPKQLAQDQAVAQRDGLSLKTMVGDMRDLSAFADDCFDFIFHPCSISFIPDVQPVFDEVYRVLKPGGSYVLGFCNPFIYTFDYDKMQQGELLMRHAIPYSDSASLSPEELAGLTDANEPLCFGHSLDQIIGGQLAAGMLINGFYEDSWGHGPEEIIDKYLSTLAATRAIKP